MKRVVSSTSNITSNIINQPNNNTANAPVNTINQANKSNSTINQANFDDTKVQHVEPQEIVMHVPVGDSQKIAIHISANAISEAKFSNMKEEHAISEEIGKDKSENKIKQAKFNNMKVDNVISEKIGENKINQAKFDDAKVEHVETYEVVTYSNKIEKNIPHYNIGDVLTTTRDLSKDPNWLPCDGREISRNEYPKLYDMLQEGSFDGEWNKKEIAHTGQIIDMNCITDGDWFVFLMQHQQSVDNGSTYVYYTQNPAGAWQSKKILEDPTCHYSFSTMHHHFGEFFFFTSYCDNTNTTITCWHTANPSSNWKQNVVKSFSYSGCGMPISVHGNMTLKTCIGINNNNDCYALGFTTYKPSDNSQYNYYSHILYNDNLTTEAQGTLANFHATCCHNRLISALHYANNKWLVLTDDLQHSSHSYTGILWSSDSLVGLTTKTAQSNTIYTTSGSPYREAFFTNIAYGNGYYVVAKAHTNVEDSPTIYYAQQLTDTFQLALTLPVLSQSINVDNRTLIFAEGKFMFMTNSNNAYDHNILYTATNPTEWSQTDVAGMRLYKIPRLSYSAENRMIFAAACKGNYSIEVLWKKVGKSLPKFTPPIGLKAYIKAKEEENS